MVYINSALRILSQMNIKIWYTFTKEKKKVCKRWLVDWVNKVYNLHILTIISNMQFSNEVLEKFGTDWRHIRYIEDSMKASSQILSASSQETGNTVWRRLIFNENKLMTNKNFFPNHCFLSFRYIYLFITHNHSYFIVSPCLMCMSALLFDVQLAYIPFTPFIKIIFTKHEAWQFFPTFIMTCSPRSVRAKCLFCRWITFT